MGISTPLIVSIYFSTAGNTSKLEKAKVVIRDAIFGIAAVLTVYLPLYAINSNLVENPLNGLSNLSHTASASVSF